MQKLKIKMSRETDGHWIAEIRELPGVMAYGPDMDSALRTVQVLALRVMAEMIEHGERIPLVDIPDFLAVDQVMELLAEWAGNDDANMDALRKFIAETEGD